jgi:hypothetical protein
MFAAIATTTARRTADTIAALTLSRRRVRDCARLLAHAAGALGLDTPNDDVALGSPADAAHVARALLGAHREAVAAVESLGRLVEAPAPSPAVEASIPAAADHDAAACIAALLEFFGASGELARMVLRRAECGDTHHGGVELIAFLRRVGLISHARWGVTPLGAAVVAALGGGQ